MSRIRRSSESELDNKLLKKYKVTTKTSTILFKRINQIYYHHDDDLYGKNKMIIEYVNDDCLAEIFMYIPACERSKIALVCKKWERILDNYSWFDVKKLELTHWEYDEYPNYLIKNYPTIDGQFNFLKSLLNKCGRYLIELDLTAYCHRNIVPVINESCPNLVKLRIRIKYAEDAHILDNNAFAGLSKLQVLKIIFQCFTRPRTTVPIPLLNSLLNVADTLTELNLSSWTRCTAENAIFPEEYFSVVSQLKALESTQVGGITSSDSLTDRFASTRPQLIRSCDDFKYLENNIDPKVLYEQIKKLYIVECQVTDDFLYNVANVMKQLHTLQIDCSFVTHAGMIAISKINNLKFLDFFGFNDVTDSSIKLFKNLSVLNLPFSEKITNEGARKALENSPKLKYLGATDTSVTSEFIKIADEISKSREKKLELILSSCNSNVPIEKIEYDYLTVDFDK